MHNSSLSIIDFNFSLYSLAGTTTFLSSGFKFDFSIIKDIVSYELLFTSPFLYSQPVLKYLLIISCLDASLTASSSYIPNPTLLTPISVGDWNIDSSPVIFSIIFLRTGNNSKSLL